MCSMCVCVWCVSVCHCACVRGELGSTVHMGRTGLVLSLVTQTSVLLKLTLERAKLYASV